jgi:adenosyl cobinamide kinase/adenosyl cobinamide phosphate guanylyltransferase
MAMEKAKANRDITNGEMREQITKHLKRREQNRKEFLAKHPDAVFKRTPYDSIAEKGMLNADSILAEYNLIKEKKSKLSSAERYVIVEIISMAIQNVIIKQMKAERKAKKELADAEKPKKRTRKKSSKAL